MGKRNYHLHDGQKGSALAVRVTPRASRNEIVEVQSDGTVRIRLTAPPVEGRANAALIDFLAGVLEVAPSRIEIVAGESGRDKLVSILDMESVEVQQKILHHLE